MSQVKMLKMAGSSIAEKWDAFRPEIESALPPISIESPDRMNKVLEKIITDEIECYVVYTENDDGSKNLLAIMTLIIIGSVDSTHKDLVIYTLTGTHKALSPDQWIESMDMVKAIGRSKGCARTLLYSNDLAVIRFMERLGADVSYRVVAVNN